MKLRIRHGRAIRKVTPRADGPAGKIRVKNKQTGKTTFVSPKTLEEHPDRYEHPKTKRLDKQKRKEMARQELEKRRKEKTKEEKERAERLEDMPRLKEKVEETEKQKAKEEKERTTRQKSKEKIQKERKERQVAEEDKQEQIRLKKERHQTWKKIQNDHPELTPEQQKERKELFFEKGVDSGGQTARNIRWWLQHHGADVDEGVEMDKPKERKLDRKTVQEHYKYGPKPNKRGECGGQLKAVKVGNLTICVDPNMYDVPEK